MTKVSKDKTKVNPAQLPPFSNHFSYAVKIRHPGVLQVYDIKDTFKLYSGGDGGVNCGEFVKLCKDIKVLKKKILTSHDVELLFIRINLNSDDTDGVDKEFASKAQGIADKIMDISQSLDLVDEHGYIQNHVDIIRDKVNEMAIVLPEQEDDIELEIPGENPEVDKELDKKLSKQDRIIKDFQRLQKQMKTHLELYKTSESEENKKTALQMLKNLTPEFQTAKKAYEKLKGVKI